MPAFWRTNDGDVIKDALRRLDAQYLAGVSEGKAVEKKRLEIF